MKLDLPYKSLALIGYILLSAIFILWSLWGYLQNQVAASAYNRGLSDAVTQLIQEAEKCEAFPVFVGDKQIQLQQVDCTKPAAK